MRLLRVAHRLSFLSALKVLRGHRAVVALLPIPCLCHPLRTGRAQTAGTARMQTISSASGARTSFSSSQEYVFSFFLLLSSSLCQTLDALPAHLVTPFNGVPPSNLLDKIARGVSHAKGPLDWPHSLRATRVKLIELSRLRAKEQAAAAHQRDSIAEEPEDAMEIEASYSYTHDGRQKPLAIAKRPLYRQSSMDFMLNAEETDKDNNEHLARSVLLSLSIVTALLSSQSLQSAAVHSAPGCLPTPFGHSFHPQLIHAQLILHLLCTAPQFLQARLRRLFFITFYHQQ